ncbi:hypothetical protein L2I63_17365 [Bacillus cereus]|uniref:hypothetical protein n=1 Tax=Bacillus cereus TaxID=1396 RepID=UPI0020CE0098|nr:hypothetical protein [Bacillus cereus]
MLWLKILFLVVIFISQMYVIQFQSSDEAKDERGREIQYKTNNVLYNILSLGIIAIFINRHSKNYQYIVFDYDEGRMITMYKLY